MYLSVSIPGARAQERRKRGKRRKERKRERNASTAMK